MPLRPAPLAPGARIALLAPAGPLRGESDLSVALHNVRSFGWEPVEFGDPLAVSGYFAGSDDQRAAALNAALTDERVDGIWFLRGGYGAMRILDRVDFSPLRRRAIPLVGYSDITAIHLAAAAEASLVTFHGPTARESLGEFSRRSLAAALTGSTDPCGLAPDATVLREGEARGRLAGGNLALLAALCGTRYAPSLHGCIVVLEDINEPVYRVDRMLTQLRMSGALKGCTAIAFGQCTNCPEEAGDGARTLGAVLGELAAELRVPCALGLPIGHLVPQWTVPLGEEAVFRTEAGKVTLNVLAS